MLQGGSADSEEDGRPQFAEIFVIIWFGSVIITFNSKLLGGTMWVNSQICIYIYLLIRSLYKREHLIFLENGFHVVSLCSW